MMKRKDEVNIDTSNNPDELVKFKKQDEELLDAPPSTSFTASNNSEDEVSNNFWKDYVARLNHELKLYNDKYGSLQKQHNEKSSCHGIQLPNWMLSSRVMSPLFTAYDIRIEEIENLLEEQSQQLVILTDTTKELINENGKLRNDKILEKNMSSVDEKSINEQSKLQNINDNIINDNCDTNEKNNRKQYYETHNSSTPKNERNLPLLDTENRLLCEQIELLTSELKSAYQELKTKHASVSQSTQNITLMSQKIMQLEQLLRRLQKEKCTCEFALVSNNNELGDCKKKLNVLNQDLERMKQSKISLNGFVEELKAERKDLQNEMDILAQKISISSTRLNDIEAKLVESRSQNQILVENNTALTVTIESTKNKNNEMDELMQTMEQQMNSLQNLNNMLEQSSQKYQIQMEEAVLLSNKTDAQLIITKAELKKVLKEREDEMIEKTEKEHLYLQGLRNQLCQYEKSMDCLKQEMKKQQDDLKSSNKKLRREKENMEINYKNLKVAYEKDIEQIQEEMNNWEVRLISAEKSKDQVEFQSKKIERERDCVKRDLETNKKELLLLNELLLKERLCNETQMNEHQTKCSSLETKIHSLEKEVQYLSECIKNQERENLSNMENKILQHAVEVKKLQNDVTRAEESCLNNDIYVKDLIEKQKQEIYEMRTNHEDAVSHLENLLKKEIEISKYYQSKNKELTTEIKKKRMETEKQASLLLEANIQISSLENDLQAAEDNLKELGIKFAEKIQEMKAQGIEERNTKLQLRTALMEIEMMKQQH